MTCYKRKGPATKGRFLLSYEQYGGSLEQLMQSSYYSLLCPLDLTLEKFNLKNT